MAASAQPQPATVGSLIDEYVKLRDRKAKAKKKLEAFIKEEYTDKMEAIEATIMEYLSANGLLNVKGAAGTAFKVKTTSVTTADSAEFRRHVIGSEEWDLLDWRPNKTMINQLAENNEPIPPGVNYSASYEVQVRRKSE